MDKRKGTIPHLAIKLNNYQCEERCELCGNWTEPQIGPALFLDGTWRAVCHECGQKHAPELVALLEGCKPCEARDGIDMAVWGEVFE
jgi:hypothetical protein